MSVIRPESGDQGRASGLEQIGEHRVPKGERHGQVPDFVEAQLAAVAQDRRRLFPGGGRRRSQRQQVFRRAGDPADLSPAGSQELEMESRRPSRPVCQGQYIAGIRFPVLRFQREKVDGTADDLPGLHLFRHRNPDGVVRVQAERSGGTGRNDGQYDAERFLHVSISFHPG
ncbi:hypothetical protein SDC9_168019 [bioreactor metagenome]|uniref:Uncharacterized protein n=1 Tax=bioreactor metagenome TaxID=1076179 RepID=A0A645G3Z7_9ZZZZ